MTKMTMIEALEKLAELNDYNEILVQTNAGEPQLIENAIEDVYRNAENPDETFDLRVTEDTIRLYDENGYFDNNEPLFKVVKNEPESDEITESQQKQILTDLVNDEEIVMLYDDMNNCYRPLWKNEWDTQQDVKSEDEANADIEKYKPYIATETDIDMIIENGSLEWENDGKNWYVKIWW